MDSVIVLSPLGSALSKLDGEPLAKQNVTGLLHDVQSQAKAALSELSSDPSKAMEMLNQVIAALNVAEDQATSAAPSGGTGSAAPVASGGTDTIKAADAVPTKVTHETHTETPVVPDAASATDSSSSSAPAPSGTPPSTDTQKAFQDAMQKRMDEMAEANDRLQKALAEVLAKVNRPAVPQGDGVPIGDLPTKTPLIKVDAAIDALNEGNLTKAMDAAGGANKLYDKVEDEVAKQMAASGITIRKYFVLGTPQQSQ